MSTELDRYLDGVRARLRLGSSAKRGVIREIYTHLQDRVEELRERGLSEDEAGEAATRFLGSPELVCHEIYQVYSQGSWRQALLAALPHSLFAMLFALHWWQNIAWLSILLASILGVTAYGWRRGKPDWLFPWLGYSLVPVIIAGAFLLYLPTGWSWLAIIAYLPLALWLLFSIARQTIERDWLYGSLMLLPIPIMAIWVLALEWETGFLTSPRLPLLDAAPWIALSFLTLAIAAATFVRLRQRWLKTGALLTAEILLLIMAALLSKSGLGFVGWLILASLSLGLLLSPALLERRLGREGK